MCAFALLMFHLHGMRHCRQQIVIYLCLDLHENFWNFRSSIVYTYVRMELNTAIQQKAVKKWIFCIRVCIHVYMCINIYIMCIEIWYIHICICICKCIYVSMCMYVSVCIHVCMSIYPYMHVSASLGASCSHLEAQRQTLHLFVCFFDLFVLSFLHCDFVYVMQLILILFVSCFVCCVLFCAFWVVLVVLCRSSCVFMLYLSLSLGT